MPPQTLVDAVKAGTCVPFIGSGVSVSVGRGTFPDWAGLVERLAKKLDAENLGRDAKDVRAHLSAKRYPEERQAGIREAHPESFRR